MTKADSPGLIDRHGGLVIGWRDHVHEDMPGGPTFGESRWDCQKIRRPGFPTRWLNFDVIPEGYRQDVKLFLLFQGRPHHPYAEEMGIRLRRNPAPLEALVSILARFALMTRWGAANRLANFSAWTQTTADGYLEDLRNGKHHEKGKPNEPPTVRAHATLLQQVRMLGPAATHPLTFSPWPKQTGREVAKDESSIDDARTSPLPRETWNPLMAAAAFVVFECSDLILEGHRALRRCRTTAEMGRGTTKKDADALVQDYLDGGGLIPLFTAFGRNKRRSRGSVNRALLCRKLDLSDTVFRPSSRAYNPSVIRVIDDAVDAGLVEYGGLVHCPPSSVIAEIGMDEAEYLPSLLRGACYVLIASLSAMRDSEVQALEREAIGPDPDLPTIVSMTYKHAGVFGRSRSWWVCLLS